MKESIGDDFQQLTRYFRGQLSGGYLDMANRPKPFKEYPKAKKIRLEAPKEPQKALSLARTLAGRSSIRRFSQKALDKETLSFLVWATAGIRGIAGGHAFRTAPSAGALYPVETYLAVSRVNEIEPGIYHYNVKEHSLEQLGQGDFGRAVAAAALDQRMCLSSAVTFIFSAIFQRSKWKYRQRAFRYIYLDAGHMGQNLALAAAGMGLGTCAIGAIYDDEANAILDLDGKEESVIYMTVCGHPAGSGNDSDE
ncbi:MAG: SagB/ThcOx family dehydrogenase [Desulfatibacillaceae bacterium]|nr:SagB/ThcOx family dehydrogenase [Desulfatibacillaceae bacterium]